MTDPGLQRAIVVDADDPLARRRLKLRIPSLLGEQTIWAEACVPPGSRTRPKPGQLVWVLFEGGDPTRPVWIGLRP